MRFWCTSAILPLVVEEPGSDLVARWIEEDDSVVVWGLTRLEVTSAVERAARSGRLSSAQRRAVMERASRIAADAHEVTDLDAVRARALGLVARHPLRAADAAQLAAALLIADPDPASLAMVVLDRRLADAAEREGLRVLTWPD